MLVVVGHHKDECQIPVLKSGAVPDRPFCALLSVGEGDCYDLVRNGVQKYLRRLIPAAVEQATVAYPPRHILTTPLC